MSLDTPPYNKDVIRTNYHKVLDRINATARFCGRNPDDISLVVVTKTQPVGVIRTVIEAGATNIGENYVEEAVPKIQALESYKHVNWHMIGHIQSRKAEKVCEYFQFAHSIDSLKLAERISRFTFTSNNPLPVWIEFNIGGEDTKSGWNIAKKEDWREILPDIEKIYSLPGLILLGLMTMPPYSHDPEDSRPFFRKLREFREFLVLNLHMAGFDGFSMGMSSDFEIAIQEGSTCLRIGQAILGPRSG